MRVSAALMILLLGFSGVTTAQAQQSSDCKKCQEQRQACTKNYSANVCKTEYDICMKGCKK